MKPDYYCSQSIYMKFFLTIGLVFLFSIAQGQSLNPNWKQELSASLQQFLNCESTPGDVNGCNKFQGKSLQTVYRINDFYSQKLKRYMTTTEIANYLKDSKTWSLLGYSYDQETLSKAQEKANSKQAVVAAYLNEEGLGHVVVIIPGELQASGSWGLKVPNTASFFVSEPEKSFIEKGLSYAFGKSLIKDVLIYTRNY